VSRVNSIEHSYSGYATPQLPHSHGKGFCHWLTVRQGGVLNFSSNQVFFNEKIEVWIRTTQETEEVLARVTSTYENGVKPLTSAYGNGPIELGHLWEQR
jgi:hypothetical protein